jgi:hypothetical protein
MLPERPLVGPALAMPRNLGNNKSFAMPVAKYHRTFQATLGK